MTESDRKKFVNQRIKSIKMSIEVEAVEIVCQLVSSVCKHNKQLKC